MGDHFVLLVDRLLTESTLEAVIESRNMSQQATPSAVQAANVDLSSHKIDLGKRSSKGNFVECRICHDEDEDLNMEAPCSCCCSLKDLDKDQSAQHDLNESNLDLSLGLKAHEGDRDSDPTAEDRSKDVEKMS